MNGYHGRFLKVDLGTSQCTELPLENSIFRNYIGGATLAASLIYEHVSSGMDPLAPESPLIFATGPLTGTSIPMVSRYAVCAISPLTGYWGEATSGGRFPFRLKGTGYDGLFITGRAEKPVYLAVESGRASVLPADDLWGLDTYQTQEAIRKRMNKMRISIACIGPAGERLIRYAAIMNDRGRAAGRCGMGAVMGSKNLKAVVVGGSEKPELSDRRSVNALAREAVTTINGKLTSVALKEYGTLFYMDMGMALGDVPARYYTKNVFPAEKVSGQALRQRYTVMNYACQGCPIGCGREIRNSRPDLPRVDGPEFETTAALGPLCLNFDLDTIVTANHMCNAFGVDTISTGASIAYAMYLYEKGVLTRENAGMEIPWGDGPVIIKLVELIATKKGIGRQLGKGTRAMAAAFDQDPQQAAQVKGLEIPMHDARAFHGQAITYATGPRGACHLKGEYFNVDLGQKIKEYDIYPGDRFVSEGKAATAARLQSLKDLYDALTLCKFAPLKVTQLCDILNAVTGWQIDPSMLLTAGERSINLKRAISSKLGLAPNEDQIPEIARKALKEGATAEETPDLPLMIKEYYTYMGWDGQTGMPLKQKLIELGLNQVAQDIYPDENNL